MRIYFVRRYVGSIRHVFELLQPEKEEELILHTMRFVFLQCFLYLGSFFFFFFLGAFDLKNMYLFFCMTILINQGMFQELVFRMEKKLLFQLENYLGIVRHFYFQLQNVEEAVFESMWEAGRENGRNMEQLYRFLCISQEEKRQGYRELAPNKFYFSFYTICCITMEYGDIVEDGKSVFLKNLNALKKEIRMEYLKRMDLEHRLKGLFFVSILPIFFLRWIEDFSIGNLPELQKYYQGGYGIFIFVLIPGLSFLGCQLCFFLRGRNEKIYDIRSHWIGALAKKMQGVFRWYRYHFPKRIEGLQALLKRAVCYETAEEVILKRILVFFFLNLLGVFVLFQSVAFSRETLLNYTEDYQSAAFLKRGELAAAQEQIRVQCRSFHDRTYSDRKLKKKLVRAFYKKGYVLQEKDAKKLVKEIKRRITAAKKVRIPVWKLLLLELICFFMSYFPLMELEIRAFFIKKDLEDEMGQFHAVISMIHGMKGIHVSDILEWLESVSFYFQDDLLECMDRYDYMGEEALEILREKEVFPSFGRLIEDLENCDRVGIEKAFEEIEGQRELFYEKRKQDNEREAENKGVIGKAAAFLPIMITIGFYLIIPFVLESMEQLNGYLNEVRF